ncbi:Putative transcriptional regulator [Paucilactobacillus oligofermentans DSM 15707 = LMG 22743]|nr:WYL domain-containing protein [Paucilactobacillus oligofermentans]CUS25397.1 Putative transcriptional regulator [Paucilactobacillus oligofermentans DSM 15707 = LMG 22743]
MNSNQRIAEMIVRLDEGELLNVNNLQDRYEISERTLRRYVKEIQYVLLETNAGQLNKKDGALRLDRRSKKINFDAALATGQVVIGSRAFNTIELEQVLEFIGSCLPTSQQSDLKYQLNDSKYGYIPLSDPKPALDMIKQVTKCITNKRQMIFEYRSSRGDISIHHAVPLSLFFEVHYFYVAMESEEHNTIWHYRLDRIIEIKNTVARKKSNRQPDYSIRNHKKLTYLQDMGPTERIVFEYRNYVQTALDAFPSSEIIKTNSDGSHIIRSYVKVGGAILWLLSQGSEVKVLSPLSLVNQMQDKLKEAQQRYEE